ncbi:MAG: transglycosylase SLT domain-containing protein [Oligoflexia bacterium]|nr:transglycosylase SLT domain-containing protein [Oligoflexia bacterium]
MRNLININRAVTLLTLTFTCMFFLHESAYGFGRKPSEPTKPPPSQPTPKPPEDVSPDVIRARWEASQRDGAKWSQFVFDQITKSAPDLLAKRPSDIRSFCANYDNLSKNDKKNFWVYLLSSMTQLESGHRPEVQYKEAFNDSKGKPVISRGLLQISIESGNGYGCGFKNESELHDPYKNLDCGLKILNRWIGRDGLISGKSGSSWRGGARYWAVLRKDSHLSNIRSWTQNQDICLVR